MNNHFTVPSITFYNLKTNTQGTLEGGAKFPFPTVLCIGSFDGVHLGHLSLVKKALSVAGEKRDSLPSIVSGAWFFTHPTKSYLLGKRDCEITTLDEKLEIMRLAGLDYAFVASFPEVRNIEPEDFINDIIKSTCSCTAAICGYDFRFGRFGRGTPEMLCDAFGKDCSVIECVTMDGLSISSTSIREYLERGEVENANKMLGYPFFLSATVIHGKRLGRKIGAPTANTVFPADKLIPMYGVYAVKVKIDGDNNEYIGVSNVGKRPTIDDFDGVTCETYIIDFKGDLYGKQIRVFFHTKIRDEKKFSDINELSDEIAKNVRQARDYFAVQV